MPNFDVSPWIQWPLLAAFLMIVFFVGRHFIDKEKQSNAFIQKLAEDGIAAYKAHAEATERQNDRVTKVVEENTKAWNHDAEAIFVLTRAVEQHNHQDAKEHATMGTKIDTIMAAKSGEMP